jgi:choline dehydrogenase-like flavoprotein
MPAPYDFNDSSVVVIVGSGAGGGTLANELARQGVDVVVLEAGGRLTVADFRNDDMAMFGLFSWLDERTTSGSWSVARTSPALPVWTCKGVGGTTLHWAGCALRFKPHELRARTTYGEIPGTSTMDWPIDYEELAPWYDRAEDKMGVTGTHDIPHLPVNNNGKIMYAGARAIGYTQVGQTHMAINSEPRAGRPGCQQAGFCVQGCTFSAKWTTLYTEVPAAERTGRCEVRANSHVLRIEHDARGRVSGVVYSDADGNQQRQGARAVCVAANSIESPRLLLNSASPMFPDGLANSSGQVGRNYTRHLSGSVFAVFDKPVRMYRGTTQSTFIEDEAGHDGSRGFAGGYLMELISMNLPALAPNYAPGGWGREYTSLLDSYDHLAGLWIVGEDLSVETNAVTLHPERRDRFGLPIANVHSDDHPNDLAMQEHAYRQGEALYRAVGATTGARTGCPRARATASSTASVAPTTSRICSSPTAASSRRRAPRTRR